MLAITVTSAGDADANTPEAIGTLRQAIFDANADDDHDIIDFAPGLNGETITLTQGVLLITESVTIDGTVDGDCPSEVSLGITINGDLGGDGLMNGNGDSVIGEIGPGSPIDATLIGLTITGGDAENGLGGGIDFTRQSGSLTVRDSTIIGNATNGQGGGLDSRNRSILIERSVISGNMSQGDGGGFYWRGEVDDQVQILDTTISGNSATGDGGGMVEDCLALAA